MDSRIGALVERAQAGRSWLRDRGLVSLAAALLLEVSTAAPGGRPHTRGVLRALALLLLLFLALVVAAIDGAVSLVVAKSFEVGRAALARAPWHVPALQPISASELFDKQGRPLRGSARKSRIASLERERARIAYQRSLRGRTRIAYERLRASTRVAYRQISGLVRALETTVIGARSAIVADVRHTQAWLSPRAARVRAEVVRRIAPLSERRRAVVATTTARTRAALAPRFAVARSRTAVFVAGLSRSAVRASARASALLTKVPLPRIPVPALSIRTLRVVTVGVTLSFVFATAIGTTGLVATQGTVALGASTTLTIISGDVSVQDPSATDFVAAVDGQVLQAGMSIRTGADSYAILTYFEGSTVSIDPNTVLVIEALVANPDGSTIIGMRQDVGRTWHAVTKLLTAGSKYEVRTPNATATVRGTQFIVGVAEDAQGVPVTLIETAEGAVAAERPASAQAPQGEEVIVPAGFQVQAKSQEVIPPPVPAPEPERKVTVQVSAPNALVVDPQGRSNGEKDGKIVVQTPGAKVEKTADGKVVVTLPNISDGKVSTVVQASTVPSSPGVPPPPPAPVQIVTTISEKGKSDVKSEETVQAPVNAPAVTGVEVKKSEGTAPAELRKLDDAEKQQAPAPKVAEAQKPAEPEKKDERKAADDQKREDASPSPQGVVSRILSVTLPPLSKEELAKREEDRKKAEERAKQEADRRERERQAAEEKRIEELKRNEERAKEELRRVAQERGEAERRVSEETSRRESESRDRQSASESGRGSESAGQSSNSQGGGQAGGAGSSGQGEGQARQQEQAPAPVVVIQQFLKAITPAEPPRQDERKAEDLRRAEQRAKEEAQKLEDERVKAEAREREKQIAKQEEARRDSERKGEELRRAEQKAKEEADRKVEELKRLEEKAREQTQRLQVEQRREAEKRLQEFRENEERARREESRRLEEQRRAEERVREQAEERLRDLRRQEEQAREKERRREREREEERARERDRNRFVPNETLKPLPGRTRSIDEEATENAGSKKSEIETAVREIAARADAAKQERQQKANAGKQSSRDSGKRDRD